MRRITIITLALCFAFGLLVLDLGPNTRSDTGPDTGDTDAFGFDIAVQDAHAQGKKRGKKSRKKARKRDEKDAGKSSDEDSKKGSKKLKVFDFTGLDVSGQLRAPQLLYFLDRANEELQRASLERRSFIPELVGSIDEESL